jgi:pimeloyl-ACP methyl ester carboxylesterase
MPHKFFPRKGLNRKDEPEAEEQTSESPPPEQAPAPEQAEDAPSAPPTKDSKESILSKSKGRSTKDSILKRLPGRKPAPAEEPPSEAAEAADDDDAPSPPPAKQPRESILKGRGSAKGSAKESLLKKLPARAGQPRSRPRFESTKKKREGPARLPSQGGVPKGVLLLACLGAFLLVGGGVAIFVLNQVPGYRSSVMVSEPSRLDWPFVADKRSTIEPPADITLYDSKKQRYELYVPPDLDPDKPAPLILFISPEARPVGWSPWQKVCVDNKAIFVGPHGTGDDRPLKDRAHMVLDAFDDVRRNYKTDPDRTYIVGFAGGAAAASRIAFSLPELFGGVVCLSGGDLVRDEPWLRQRVADRLSVAWVYGDATGPSGDPTKPQVERLYKPFFEKLKIRSNAWPMEGQGKGMPSSTIAPDIFSWLEEGLAKRQEVAKSYPASRMPGDAAWTREEWAKKVYEEASARVKEPRDTDTFFTGAAQLHGCNQRWQDLPPPEQPSLTKAGDWARKADKLYIELYQQDKEKPWLKEDALRRRALDLALARALSDYLLETEALDTTHPGGFQQYQDQIEKALSLWQVLINQGGDEKEQAEARKKKAALEDAKFGRFVPATDKDKDKKTAE